MNLPELKPGQMIAVYSSDRVELGKGTFVRKSYLEDLDMTAYECEEHTILARGPHFVKAGGQVYSVVT